jgi:hypothetical protein
MTFVGRVALALALFLLSWSALHVGFYEHDQIVDTPVYEEYGNAMVDGEVPYRDFDVEYPPGALPVFVLPALGDRDYRGAFEWLMALCGCGLIVGVALASRPLGLGFGTLAFVALAPLALGSVLLTRFDLWPAMLASFALAALVHDRLRLGHGLLGAAVAAKLYPGVFLPLALAYAWRRHGRREALVCAAVFAVVVAVVYLPFLAIAPDGVAHSIGRQLSRPLQIESLGASVLLVAHQVLGVEIEMRSSHGSQNLVGTAPTVLAVVVSVAQVVVVGWLWVLAARWRRPSPAALATACAAALAAFVALGKVLSPQFLIWLIPVVPLAASVGAAALLLAALVLTQLWFPFRYWDLARELDAGVSWLVFARDLVLVALVALLVRDATARARESSRSA